MNDDQTLVELDGRRRLSLGKLGRPDVTHYIVEEGPSGVITLIPAVVVPITTLERLKAKETRTDG